MANVVKYLEASAYGFNVYVAERAYVVGYSIEENLTRLVRKSKRVMFCVSDDFNERSENFRLAWNISAKKIKETKSNCGIVVCKGSSIIKNTEGINVERVIRKDRILYSDKRLFVQKLTYAMPHIPRKLRTDCNLDMQRLSNNAYEETIHNIFDSKGKGGILDGQLRQYDVFISCANDDIDYVINDLLPLLERKGHKSCIPDRDCIAGPTKQETFLTAIKSSHRTILILSDHHSLDDWSLFTFQMACGKTRREKYNHLIVIVKNEPDISHLDEEVKQYLNTYVTLKADDRWFEQKIFSCLPFVHEPCENPFVHLNVDGVGEGNEAFEMVESDDHHRIIA